MKAATRIEEGTQRSKTAPLSDSAGLCIQWDGESQHFLCGHLQPIPPPLPPRLDFASTSQSLSSRISGCPRLCATIERIDIRYIRNMPRETSQYYLRECVAFNLPELADFMSELTARNLPEYVKLYQNNSPYYMSEHVARQVVQSMGKHMPGYQNLCQNK